MDNKGTWITREHATRRNTAETDHRLKLNMIQTRQDTIKIKQEIMHTETKPKTC